MKVKIRYCPYCEKDTLQARTKIGQSDEDGIAWRKVWFCSLCSSYLEKRGTTNDVVVTPGKNVHIKDRDTY